MTIEPQRYPPTLTMRALSKERQLKWVAIAILAVASIALVFWAGSHLLAQTKSQNAGESPPPNTFRATDAQLVNLKIEAVSLERFHDVEVTDGKIALNLDRATPVFSPYSGRVMKLFVGIGEFVRQGAKLVEVDATEYTQAQSDLRNAEAQLKLATINEERKHAAFDSKGGSLQDWQQAQVNLASARNAFESARNRLHVLGRSDEEIDAIAQAKEVLGRTYIVAPISGVVTDRQVGPGQYLQAASSTPIYAIGDLSTVWLVANVREVDAPKIHRGQPIEVHVLALPNEVLTSKIESVGATVDPVTHRVPVRAVLENRSGLLKPEMFANFNIIGSEDRSAPGVPADAVVYEGTQARVWVVENKSDIALREIRVGRSNDRFVEVLDGLKAGERIVTRGSLFIDRAARGE